MSKLMDDFLSLGNVDDIQEEITVNVQGKALALKIRAQTEDEHTDFQRRATVINKKSVFFDKGKYTSLLLPACIIEPNFNSEEFLKKAGVNTAWELITSRLPSGVIEEISQKIQELSGFDSLDAEIEEAKN